ncbi:MAG: restriction endonuclease, partial [Halobacteriaceae archaeon]
MNTEGWTDYQVTDGVAITYPYLNGGLFRNHEIDTVYDTTITERDLDATEYDWTVLVDELNQYNWLIEEAPSEAAEQTEANKLSPAVLGHIFEKFVITVSELEDEDELSLEELDEMNISASGEQMLQGNREVGAYYTP